MRRFALGLAACLFATTALAAGLDDMTADERAAFRAEVRAYLIENPEVLIEAMGVLQQREDAAASLRDVALVQDNAEALVRNPNDWAGGNVNGDITVVEFMDYRCSYCRKAHEEVKSLVSSDGNIRYVLKEYPILGDESVLTAQFAIAVRLLHGDDAYKATHDALMTLRGAATVETLRGLAKAMGHDDAAIIAKMGSDEVKAIIEANRALGAKMEINGTPTFVIKDVLLRGYVPLQGMQEIVKDARAG